MDRPLKLTVIVNSGVEAIFAAKCCAIPDANLEIILTNIGEEAITVTGRFALESDSGIQPLNLYPYGERVIIPGEGAAFYSNMESQRWSAWRTLMVTDADGRRHRFALGTLFD